jgi:hypothetical protein
MASVARFGFISVLAHYYAEIRRHQHIFEAVKASLERLQLDSDTSIEETVHLHDV